MSYLTEPEAKELKITNEVNITPPGDSILSYLGIEPATVKSIKPLTKRTQYRAVINWLTKYKPATDASNLDRVRGYLEAFHHLSEVEAWNQALKILVINIIEPENEQLHNQLFTWGYYRNLSKLYNRFLESLANINPYYQTIFLYGMGKVYYAQGYLEKAIEYYQQALELARTLPDCQHESAIQNSLGLVYLYLQDHSKSINYHWQGLVIVWKNHNYQGQAIALNNLGLVFCQQRKYSKAIKYQQESLRILRQSYNPSLEGRVLGSLAQAYGGLENYEKAIAYQQQHLTIMRTIEDRAGEGEALFNLATTLAICQQDSESMKYFQESLEICREIGNRLTEVNVLLNLTAFYQKSGNKDLVRKHCQQAFSIANELGIPLDSFQQLGSRNREKFPQA
ncbi:MULTISPECIES: tetratricopeptide repeat protein [unclassified Microcoleus]|uniref:tetratricopeptide repeat protein n=1 Tax=unclassified Microcoleus TaxID=2642155 RepID=UPI002FD0565C